MYTSSVLEFNSVIFYLVLNLNQPLFLRIKKKDNRRIKEGLKSPQNARKSVQLRLNDLSVSLENAELSTKSKDFYTNRIAESCVAVQFAE